MYPELENLLKEFKLTWRAENGGVMFHPCGRNMMAVGKAFGKSLDTSTVSLAF